MGSYKSPSRNSSSSEEDRRRNYRRGRKDRRRRDDSRDYDHRRRRDRSYERSRRRRRDSSDERHQKDRSPRRRSDKLLPIIQSESSIPSKITTLPGESVSPVAKETLTASTSSVLTNASASSCATQVKRKKPSRFAPETDRFSVPGIPVAIAAEMDEKQRKLYLSIFFVGDKRAYDDMVIVLAQLRIEEIGLKLRTGNLGLNDPNFERSPSPEPIYNSMGVRQNTRELRVRQKLEDERHKLINEAKELNPDYKPPLDYRPTSNKIIDKVMIPQDVHPSINFIGLLIGPRGNTLKRLESESNTKIIIRGKGSLKEGKLRTQPLPGEDEPLHALVTANNPEDLRKGMALIQSIIDDGLANPDGDNELRRMQLRELAQLNGTLIASEVSRCKNCGSSDHRHWECPQAKNITNITICEKCGGGGHIASDCIYDGERAQTAEEKSKLDSAYKELMSELGVKNEEVGGTGNGVFGGESDGKNIPSILALPKVVVSQLPWANAAGGFLGTNPSAAQLSLPSSVPSMPSMHYGVPSVMGYQQMQPHGMSSFAPAPLAEAFGLPQQTSYPQMASIWPNVGFSNATTNSGIPVSELNNTASNDSITNYEINRNQNNEEAPNS